MGHVGKSYFVVFGSALLGTLWRGPLAAFPTARGMRPFATFHNSLFDHLTPLIYVELVCLGERLSNV